MPPDPPDENPNDTDPGMTRTFRRLKKRPPAPRRAVNKDETLSPRRTPPMKPHVGMLPPREILARLIPGVMESDWSLSSAIFSSPRPASWAGLLALAPLLFLNSIRALMQEPNLEPSRFFFSRRPNPMPASLSTVSLAGGKPARTKSDMKSGRYEEFQSHARAQRRRSRDFEQIRGKIEKSRVPRRSAATLTRSLR